MFKLSSNPCVLSCRIPTNFTSFEAPNLFGLVEYQYQAWGEVLLKVLEVHSKYFIRLKSRSKYPSQMALKTFSTSWLG